MRATVYLLFLKFGMVLAGWEDQIGEKGSFVIQGKKGWNGIGWERKKEKSVEMDPKEDDIGQLDQSQNNIFITLFRQQNPLSIIQFGERSPRPLNGVSLRGVTFSYLLDGQPNLNGATFGQAGPGCATYVQGPAAEGNSSGVVVIRFDQPVAYFEIGVARQCTENCGQLNPAFRARIRFVGGAIQNLNGRVRPLITFGEGRLIFRVGRGKNKIRSVRISFGSPEKAPRFAIDNLTFSRN